MATNISEAISARITELEGSLSGYGENSMTKAQHQAGLARLANLARLAVAQRDDAYRVIDDLTGEKDSGNRESADEELLGGG